MKYFKELIKQRKIIVFLLCLFLFISGLLILILGLSMILIGHYTGSNSLDRSIITATFIFGFIVLFVGYIVPRCFVKLTDEEERKKKFEKQILHEKINAVKHIRGVRLASDEEKQEYITAIKIFNPIVFTIVGMFFTLSFSLIFGSLFSEQHRYPFLIISIFSIIIGLIIVYFYRKKDNKRIKKFMDSDIYIAHCYECDRKKETFYYESNYTRYFIKITDGNDFIDGWFSINHKMFNDPTTIKVKLYVSEELEIYNIVPYV